MKMKKVLAIALVGAFALSMAACGASAPAEAEAPAEAAPAVEEASAPAEETSADAEAPAVTGGELIMATNAAFPPYEFVGEGGEYAGIDVEIANAIAAELGMTLVIDDIDFDSIIPSIQTGKADMGVAGMTVTDERLENVNFSESYATGTQVIIVTEDSDIATVDDLEGKMIGVQQGTTGDIYCQDDYGIDNVTEFPNGANAVQALLTGKVDCVVIDNQPAMAFVEQNEGLKILETEYVVEDYAIAIAKDNTELLDQVNAALATLKEDGTLDEIIAKYIVAE